MAELKDWSGTAASNNSSPPDGFPESMNYSEVNDAARETMAVIARHFADQNGSLASAGSSNAYTLTPSATLSAYAAGDTFAFKANHTNTGAATLNVDALGAKAIVLPDNTALKGGAITINGIYLCYYDGTSFQLLNGTVETVTTAVKTADEGITNDASVSADTDLTITGIAAGTYEISMFLHITCTDSAPGFKYGLVASPNSDGNALQLNATDSVPAHQSKVGQLNALTYTVTVASTGASVAKVSGHMEVSGTTSLTLHWAQTSSNAASTVLKKGSWLKVRQLA